MADDIIRPSKVWSDPLLFNRCLKMDSTNMIEFANWIEKLLIAKPNEELSFVLTNFVYWDNKIIDVPIKVLRKDNGGDFYLDVNQFLYVQVPFQRRWELVYSAKTNEEIATKLIIDGIGKIRDIVACFEISRKVHLVPYE